MFMYNLIIYSPSLLPCNMHVANTPNLALALLFHELMMSWNATFMMRPFLMIKDALESAYILYAHHHTSEFWFYLSMLFSWLKWNKPLSERKKNSNSLKVRRLVEFDILFIYLPIYLRFMYMICGPLRQW